MRFFRSAQHESWESEVLPKAFGKAYEPGHCGAIAASTTMSTAGVRVMEVGGELLHIDGATASWAFLNRREAALYAGLHGSTVGELLTRWPADATGAAQDFVASLYRRGLLALDGCQAVDSTMFDDGPNTEDSHLVELLVTEKCNLACGYCLAGATPKMPTMSREIGERAIDLAYRMNEAQRFAFEFSGGEPFLQFKLVRHLTEYLLNHPDRRGREVELSAQTNATVLDEEKILWAKANSVRLGVSIDGDPASHDLSRPQVNGKGSFEKVIRGIDMMQRHGVAFGVLVVLNRSNVHSAQALIDFLADNGLYSVKVNAVAFLGAGRDNWDSYGLEQEEILHYYQALLELSVQQRHPLYEATVATMCQYLVSKQRNNRCMRSHCGAGTSFQCVSAKGEAFPCGRATQSPGLAFANVLDEERSLSDAARANEHVQSILTRRPDEVGCGTCEVRQLCQSGCAVQAYERYGSVREKTPECHFFKELYPYLMRWLSHDEAAFRHLNQVGYFRAPAERVDINFVPESQPSSAFGFAQVEPPKRGPKARLAILPSAGGIS